MICDSKSRFAAIPNVQRNSPSPVAVMPYFCRTSQQHNRADIRPQLQSLRIPRTRILPNRPCATYQCGGPRGRGGTVGSLIFLYQPWAVRARSVWPASIHRDPSVRAKWSLRFHNPGTGPCKLPREYHYVSTWNRWRSRSNRVGIDEAP